MLNENNLHDLKHLTAYNIGWYFDAVTDCSLWNFKNFLNKKNEHQTLYDIFHKKVNVNVVILVTIVASIPPSSTLCEGP